ncbi:MAG: HlyD family secretion protein [Phycisphaerales bacterium]
MVKWITFVLAAIGLSAGIYTVATAKQELPKPPPSRPPSVNPFPNGVAAIGTVEPSSREIAVVAPDQGMVTAVLVQVNDRVEQGQPLFQIDTRPFDAQLIEAEAQAAVAEAQVKRLESAPRAEDLPPAEANVAAAKVALADAADSLRRTDEAATSGSASENEAVRRRYTMNAAEARLRVAEAELALVKSGAWTEDVVVARAQAKSARARLESIRIMKDRLTVRAPIGGVVLKMNVEPGEFAMLAPMQMTQAAMVIGDVSTLHVRAQVDEEDVPLVRMGAKAVARVRGMRAGASGGEFALTMLRIEPLALPKSNILGTPTERVDTRVVEVVFRVERGVKADAESAGDAVMLYSGQAVDVFIEAGAR